MRTFVAMPCMDMVQTAFMDALLHLLPTGDVEYGITCSSLIYNARNLLAKRAVDGGFDRILFLDSDMVFMPTLLQELSADMDEGREFVTGLAFKRKNPVTPTIYKETGYTKEGKELIPYALPMTEYPRNSIFEVKATGLACSMISTDLIMKVFNEFGAPFSPQPGFGEDLSFCIRCEKIGVPIYCDSRVKVGHIAQTVVTEDFYDKGVIL